MGKICSSEESKFCRADGAFGYLQQSFFSGLLRKKFQGGNGADKAKYMTLLHITREFYSIKLICTYLYALFSHVKKAYTANQNCVQLFHMWKYNQSTIA